MPKIVFWNNFHKGDMHTQKEFIRQIVTELEGYEFGYMHDNPEKLLLGLGVPTLGSPSSLSPREPFYKDENDTLYVNTWVGCFWDIFCENGGINMNTFIVQWTKIFDFINQECGTNLKIKNREDYLPRVDYEQFDVNNINEFLANNKNKKVLVCNNVPQSGQSFASSMGEYILPLAEADQDTLFICTNKIDTNGLSNVLFTDDIIKCKDGCDLPEISYLSRHCDVIIGKNSGPYVFCETYDNFMDETKTFVSLNKKHPDFDTIKETMSNGVDYKCSYTTVPIFNIESPSADDCERVYNAIVKALGYEEA